MSHQKKSVIFTYGRFNPPHLGHKKMIQGIVDRARKEKKNPIIIVSHTTGTNKNPLNVHNKLTILKSWFPKVTFLHSSKDTPLAKITDTFANNSVMIVGENRKNSFGYLKFNKGSINRNAAAPSATKARAAAVRGNAKTFKKLTGYNSPNIMSKIKSASTPVVKKKPRSTRVSKKNSPNSSI